MEEGHPKSEELERQDSNQSLRRVNWWGVFGLLCGIGSAYLSLRIFFEAITLLGKGP
jgi:hypothetical protein